MRLEAINETFNERYKNLKRTPQQRFSAEPTVSETLCAFQQVWPVELPERPPHMQ